MQKGKARLAGMKRASPFEQRRSLGKTPLLQPDGADQRHQQVIAFVRQPGPHHVIGRGKIAGLKMLPTQRGGPADVRGGRSHGADTAKVRRSGPARKSA